MKVLLNSEIKLHRNIKGFNFPSKLSVEDAKVVVDKISMPLLEKGYARYSLGELNSLEKLDLFEDGKITADALDNEKSSAVFLNKDYPTVLVNGEDHVIIIDSFDGLNFLNSYERVNEIDDLLDGAVEYAFDEEFGYLTSNPLKCGTAMILSSSLHLPATDYFGMNSILASLKRLGYLVASLSKKQQKPAGAIYKIFPDRTIGETEKSYINKFENILKEVIDMEEQNRKKLYLEKIIDLEDLVNRAYGALRYCRIIDEEEMINKMSDLFLGIELSILKPKKEIDLMNTINKFKNGHLQIEKGSLLDAKTRNILRANNIRKMMKEVF